MGLDPEEVRVPIHLWHGELDREVKAATVRALVGKLPGCEATFFGEEGHISGMVRRSTEIVAALAST